MVSQFKFDHAHILGPYCQVVNFIILLLLILVRAQVRLSQIFSISNFTAELMQNIFICSITDHSEILIDAALLHLPRRHCRAQILMTYHPFLPMSQSKWRRSRLRLLLLLAQV